MQAGARRKTRRSALPALAATAASAVAIAGCGGSADTTSNAAATAATGKMTAQLNLVAYSTPTTAYDALIPAFEQTSAGKGVGFSESFGASGAQSRAVAAGQAADVVAFSITPDITRLVKAGLVSSNWNQNADKGIVTDSVVVLVVRKGNPKHITGWDDLIKPGVDVVTPNPSTSGSARWNILAGYGAELKQGKTHAQALDYLKTLITKNVSVEDASGRAALQTFTGGKGDVLISYESEAIAAKKKGEAIDYIIPKRTILIETPIAVTSKSSHEVQAQAFVNWLFTPTAQAIWAKHGYRPVDQTVLSQYSSEYPTPADLFTIKALGGWTKINREFFAPSTGLVTKIESAAGFPTASS
jgi:sulfate transport system substrate-binding protein